MSSRMDRYKGSTNTGRSRKNQSLYDEIKNLGTYTNIEGVATIEHANEIDINEVKNLLRNRENYKKERQAGLIEEREEEFVEKVPAVEKNYDINTILNKMKNQIKERENNEYRKLSDDQYDFLKKLNAKNHTKKLTIDGDELDDEKEIKDAVNTIKLSKKVLEDTDSGLLDELKSDTMVGDASSIKSIIDGEKQKKILEDTGTMELDKSFYTSSFGFTKSDFEELKDMNQKIKKSNKFIILLLVLLILGGIAVGAYFIFLKK